MMKAMTGSLCSACLVAGMALALSSCTKDAFDLRSQYIGPYSFTVEVHGAHGVGQDWLITDTTYTDAGAVLNGSRSGIIEIKGSSFDLQAVLHEHASLTGYHNHGSGSFPTTGSIDYTYSFYSPSGSTRVHLTGNKQ